MSIVEIFGVRGKLEMCILESIVEESFDGIVVSSKRAGVSEGGGTMVNIFLSSKMMLEQMRGPFLLNFRISHKTRRF